MNNNNNNVQTQGDQYQEYPMEEMEQDNRRFVFNKNIVKILGIAFVIVVIAVIGVLMNNSKKKEAQTDDTQTENSDVIDDGDYDPFAEEYVDPFDAGVGMVTFNAEDRTELLRYGYTAEEIDQMAIDGVIVEEAIAEKQKLLDEYLMERYIELKNIASSDPAFKELIDNTWMRGDPHDVQIGEFYKEYSVRTENCRYIKVPVRGNQLFIRVALENGSMIFVTVTPERWEELKDDGNIVLRLVTVEYGGIEYIIDSEEIIPG